MSRRRSFPKTLVVEGKTDVYAVASLVKYFVDWPDSERPVEITALNGADRLDAGLVEAVAFAATRIGFILDADVDASSRYSSIRHQIGNYCPGLPANMPSGGAIADGPDGRKWGIWIMPDNRNPGGVETFLSPHFHFEPRVRISWMLVRINIDRGLKAAKTPAEDSTQWVTNKTSPFS
ncbi:MAG: hypothetical protein FJW40_10050, partial [Acidobacteria bacterium]|nr:hypothetical protein [Acidobacteriota bacterium]